MTDRRKPLGGITKESYTHAGGNEFTYDLLTGMKSDLCHEITELQRMVSDIKVNCSLRPEECEKKFITRKQFYTAMALVAAFSVGSGVLYWDKIIKLIKFVV